MTRHYSRILLVVLFFAGAIPSWAQKLVDVSATYNWKPVTIGAGGWVVGFVTHPRDSNVRYARTDVGNGYRWDRGLRKWLPLKVVNEDGTGFPGSVVTAPGPGGIQSIAIDPSNSAVLFIAAPNNCSADVGHSSGINIYRSTDGGRTFKAGNLNVPGDPNDNYRMLGERLRVDPKNSAVVYYGSGFGPGAYEGGGLYRSVDHGATWSAILSSAIRAPENVIDLFVDPDGELTSDIPLGITVGRVSRHLWACGGRMVSGKYASDVLESRDGGATWINQSQETPLGGQVAEIFLDPFGNLFATQVGTKTLWKYSDKKWSTSKVDSGDNLSSIAVDPKNSKRIFVIAQDASVSRSQDGGQTWTNFGRLQYINRFSWLPQVPGNAEAQGYRSTGGIFFDASGTLWVCQGNEGMLSYRPTLTNSESASNPPKWKIDSEGIEELVTEDIIVPRGGGDRIYTAVADATGMVVSNPDNFSAVQIPLQTNLISQGTQVTSCPNDPNTIVVSTSNVYSNGVNQSGISFDSGRTWTIFGSSLKFPNSAGALSVQAGSIAISRRGNWNSGQDHIVQLPVANCVPEYSKDGGKTWVATKSFPTNPDGLTFQNKAGYQGFWIFALKQRQLYADPFVPDRFYLKLTTAPDTLYISSDGGVTWTPVKNNGLPNSTHHGQLAVNCTKSADLWFADGWEGATSHGLFHSVDGGTSFVKIPAISNAVTLALGAGSGKQGDQPYTVYVYGKFFSDPKWGVFKSTDGGSGWQRISYYPTGIVDQPTCMAASWDSYGKVFVGFGGNSYVYGSLK